MLPALLSLIGNGAATTFFFLFGSTCHYLSNVVSQSHFVLSVYGTNKREALTLETLQNVHDCSINIKTLLRGLMEKGGIE